MQSAVPIVGFDTIDAVPWQFRLPSLLNRRTTKELREEVAEEVAEDDEHRGINTIAESAVDAVYSEVQQHDSEPVTHKTEDVELGSDGDPQVVLLL